jgi:hypothetical protein
VAGSSVFNTENPHKAIIDLKEVSHKKFDQF